MNAKTPFDDLVAVMARLRGPDGCPWDREQTLESLRTYLLEETHELLEAIENGDTGHIREELGDLLLEVVFLTQVCQERGLFGIDDVVEGIRDKLVRRHPHVFGGTEAKNPSEALQRWEEIKNQEKRAEAPDSSFLDGVPTALPALMRAHRLSTKASLAGFDWKAVDQIYDKLLEELAEFRSAADGGDAEGMREELGDLLFIMVNLGRHTGIDPEMALHDANRKFISRFRFVEERLRSRGVPPGKADMDEMEALWEEAKARERSAPEAPNQSTSSR